MSLAGSRAPPRAGAVASAAGATMPDATRVSAARCDRRVRALSSGSRREDARRVIQRPSPSWSLEDCSLAREGGALGVDFSRPGLRHRSLVSEGHQEGIDERTVLTDYPATPGVAAG